MSGSDAPDIESLASTDPRRDAALRLLLTRQGESSQDVKRRIRRLKAHLSSRPARLGAVLAASVDGQLVSSAIVIESPGRLGAAFAPAEAGSSLRRRATAALLNRAKEHAWERSLAMLQVLFDRNTQHDSAMLTEAGFDFLAELIYLERSAHDPSPQHTAPSELEFVPYAARAERRFLDVLDLTYQDSRDCPRLAGIRRTDEVLATHRATGVYDPANWLLATLDGQSAGVLLLSGVEGRRAFEVVYMGVAPAFRGRGLGHAILAQAVRICRQNQRADLILAVDRANSPARKLYQRWSFREVSRRFAWFAANPLNTRARQGHDLPTEPDRL